MGICLIEGGAAAGGSGKGGIERLGQIDTGTNHFENGKTYSFYGQAKDLSKYTYLAIQEKITSKLYNYHIFTYYVGSANNDNKILTIKHYEDMSGKNPNNTESYSNNNVCYFSSFIPTARLNNTNGIIITVFGGGSNVSENGSGTITLYGIKGEIEE